ncbi:Protein PHLOEM PROTEIN 2-LIKE A9 [Forsythia ovata]|uniref:Protein PHLOEM PROTEIN 2-LIKE A9 n=1 Tax=Forsythia ovata TaxID=205694 RepID=A0ABD1R8L7_9LAMI
MVLSVQDKDGRKFLIPAKALNIVWGRDGRFWNIPDNPGMPAELLQVSWLEVSSSVDGTNPQKNYEIGFSVSLKADAFGWNKYPVYIMMKRGKEGEFSWKKVFLNTNNGNVNQAFEISGKLMKAADSTDTKIYFGLYEVWSGKWKGGLQIHHAFVREAP